MSAISASTSEDLVRYRRVPLATALAFVFGGMIALTLTIVLSLAFYVATANTRELLADRIELTLDALTHRIEAYLEPVEQRLKEVKASLEAGELDLEDRELRRTYFDGLFTGLPQITGIAIIEDDGYAVRIARDRSVEPQTTAVTGDEIEETLAAVERYEEVVWGEPVHVPDLDSTIINARLRLDDGSARPRVIVAGVSLQAMADYLARAAIELDEPIFVLHGREQVIGYSGFLPQTYEIGPGQPLVPLEDINQPVLRSMWDEPRPLRLIEGLFDGQDQRVETPIGSFIFVWREVGGFTDLPWIIGTWFPFDEASVQVRRLIGVAVISLVLALVAILVTILIGRRLAIPVRRVGVQAQAIRRLELDGLVPLPRSHVLELDRTASAFNAMTRALRWFEAYLPERLVRQLVTYGSADAVSSQARIVTVMFTDIAGFSGRASSMSPAETAAFLNAHFAMLDKEITASDGIIDKFIGDGLMAFWNAPADQPDHAERACRTALAIRAALEADPEAPRIRIGIHTGPVLVGNIGAPSRLNYTLVGETVNTAQRLEQLGKSLAADEKVAVVIGSETRAALSGDGWRPVSCGSLEVRGASRRLEVFRL